MVMVVCNGLYAHVLTGSKERMAGMIETGDGVMTHRMTLGLCPNCRSKLNKIRQDEMKTEYKCKCCGLKINDYKEQIRPVGR